jgi:hypothetical protein
MRGIVVAVSAAIFLMGSAQAKTAAEGREVCLQAQFIDHTKVVNPSTVLFYMRGGKVWQNNLKAPCNGLNFHGFTVVGHETEICAGQGITVITTHEACVLGGFTAYTPPPASSSSP